MIPTPKLPEQKPDLAKTNVRFSLLHARIKGKWSCAKLDVKQRQALIKKAREYQQMTVMQFKTASGPRLKKITKKEFPAPPDGLSPDVADTLACEIRLSKKARLMGYMNEQCFYVIWIDPDHAVFK